MDENRNSVKVSKTCPTCGWRVLDKITPTSGMIEMKCPHCRSVITINLAYRRMRPAPQMRIW